MKRWKTGLIVTVILGGVIAASSGIAIAVGGPGVLRWPMMAAGARIGVDARPAACGSLMSDPAALQAMQALRQEHLKDMQAWRTTYGGDPSSAAAQAALSQLRQEHWQDMQRLFKQFGITRPSGGMMRPWTQPSAGPSGGGIYGPGMMGGQNGGTGTYGPGMMGGGWR